MEISPNSLNPSKGRSFQNKAAQILSQYFGVIFKQEYPIGIGSPPKLHKFDLVSEDLKYVGESKNYSWTQGKNVPSAKMAFMNEAVFYLQHLPQGTERFIVVRRDVLPNRNESLARYYFRTYQHLLNGVFILEIDLLSDNVWRVEL